MTDADALTVEEVADLLRVNRKTVYALAARNAIPHRRLGRALRFARSAVLEWLACKVAPHGG